LPASQTKDDAVPTERKQIRLILDASTEHQVIDHARKEGRRRRAIVEVQKLSRLAELIRTGTNAEPATS
jgi:hypothetical protein